MDNKSKFSTEDKKYMLHVLLRRIFILGILLCAWTIAFGMASTWQLVTIIMKYVFFVIAVVYLVLFAFSVHEQGLVKTADNFNPVIYVKELILCVLFDISPDEYEDNNQ